MRLLVTGGAGFIGAHFVRQRLASSDDSVVVLDALTYAADRTALDGLDAQRCRLVVGDITDADLVDRLVADCDAVVHFAAESHNDNALRSPRVFVETNLVGTFTVLEAVRRHGVRLHHVSTDEVHGDLALDDPARFDESSPMDPSSPYSATKAGADLLVRAWIRSFDVQATLSTCSNNYGPRQHIEKFIPRQITNVLTGRRPRVYGSGLNVRDWIHVDDHNAAVGVVLDRGKLGQTYAIGADGECSNVDVVRLVLTLMGQSPDAFDHVADRPGHDRRYGIDAGRIRSELGWAPLHTDLESGLRATIDWYRENEAWWAPLKDAVEAKYAETDH